VLVDKKMVFDLPVQRYDDSRRPTVCLVDPALSKKRKHCPTAMAEIRVQGLKP